MLTAPYADAIPNLGIFKMFSDQPQYLWDECSQVAKLSAHK